MMLDAIEAGRPPDSLKMIVSVCGTPSSQTCANKIVHDTSNTPFSTALFPHAQALERCATATEIIYWSSLIDAVQKTAISLAGVDDGHLIGFAAFAP